MENLVNITDKLTIRNLESKVKRQEMQLDAQLKSNYDLRTENFGLMAQISRLKEEIDLLKDLLKDSKVRISYE